MRTKIDPNIVISIHGKTVYYNGVPVDKKTVQQWKEDIKVYRQLTFFRSLHETLRHNAIRTGFIESQTWDHVVASKGELLLLDQIEQWLSLIEKLQ